VFLGDGGDEGIFEELVPMESRVYGECGEAEGFLAVFINNEVFGEVDGSSVDGDLVSLGVFADNGAGCCCGDFVGVTGAEVELHGVVVDKVSAADFVDIGEGFHYAARGGIADGNVDVREVVSG